MAGTCTFCLSKDRNLSNINELGLKIVSTCIDSDASQYLNYLHMQLMLKLCFECRGRVKSFSTFLHLTEESLHRLKDYWANPGPEPPTPCSNLKLVTNDPIDIQPGESLFPSQDISMGKYEMQGDDIDHSIKRETEVHLLPVQPIKLEQESDDDSLGNLGLEPAHEDALDKSDLEEKPRAVKRRVTRSTKRAVKPKPNYETRWMSQDEALVWYKKEINSLSPSLCDVCEQRFETEDDLRGHSLKAHHESIGPYICNMCKHRFADQTTLKDHIGQHHLLYKCKKCKYETREFSEIKKHKKHEYSDCDVSSDDENECKANVKQKEYTCKKCKNTFASTVLLRKHRSKCSTFKCDFCEKSFTHRTSKYSHMDLHHKPLPEVECKVCNKKFKNKYAIKSHLQKHRKDSRGDVYYCDLCKTDYKTSILYRQHFFKTVKEDGRIQFRNECIHCEIAFPSPRRLQEHISGAHSKLGALKCAQCYRRYATRKALDVHIRDKHATAAPPLRDKICHVCGKGFTSSTILTNHLRSHTGERPFKCSLCPARFAHTGSLYTHNKLVHKTKKLIGGEGDTQVYQCSECSKEFVSESRWRSHYDFFHLKKSNYACEICNKIFISAWNLKNHRTMLHGINRTRSYPCTLCGKEFFRLDALKSHKLIHSDDRTFMCSECGKTFKQQAALYTHNKLVHKGIKRPPAKANVRRGKKMAIQQSETEDKQFLN